MKGAALFGILVVSILIMGGSFYYFHEQDQKILPKYSISLDFKDNSSFNVSYPITLSGVPLGSGMYQQLITLNNYSRYGINSQGSNLAFYDASNLTHLYAWIQSINKTTMQVWVKNYNASNVIDMQVLPSYKDLFNATGYLGEAPQLSSVYGEYFNAPKVFENSTSLNAWDFAGTSLPAGFTVSGTNYTFSDGLNNYPNNYICYIPARGFGDYANAIVGQEMTVVSGLYGNGQSLYYLFYNGTYIDAIGALPTTHGNVIFLDSKNIVSNTTSAIPFYNNTFPEYIHVGKNVKIYVPAHNYYAEQSIHLANQTLFEVASQSNTQTDQHVYYLIFTSIFILDMPTFTIGSAYHPLSSFSISSNSLVVNTTFMEHNLTGYQYYAFSPVYNGNPVWFLVNGQIGDRLSVLLDGNVSLTVQILGYSYSNVIKEVKVE